MIVRKIRGEFDSFLQVLSGLGFIPNTRRPPGGVAVKHPERTMASSVIVGRIESDRSQEFLLHLADQLQSSERFCLGKFPENESKIIMRCRGIGVEPDGVFRDP